jgi:hypothetical protein
MKTTPDFNGVTLQEEAIEYGWSPANGYYTARTFKGTQSEIQNILPQLVALGYEYQVKEGPLWTCVAKTPQKIENETPVEEVPIPVFELVSQRLDKPLLESDCPFVTSLPPALIQQMRTAIRDDEGPTFLSGSFASTAERIQAADVYIHATTGAPTYPYYLPVLRKTFVVSNQYLVNESMTVNRVYSKATLISDEEIPSQIWNILPDSGTESNIIANPMGLTTSTTMPMNWGYLKAAPQYQQVGPTQFQVTVDYEYNLWAEKLYGPLI